MRSTGVGVTGAGKPSAILAGEGKRRGCARCVAPAGAEAPARTPCGVSANRPGDTARKGQPGNTGEHRRTVGIRSHLAKSAPTKPPLPRFGKRKRGNPLWPAHRFMMRQRYSSLAIARPTRFMSRPCGHESRAVLLFTGQKEKAPDHHTTHPRYESVVRARIPCAPFAQSLCKNIGARCGTGQGRPALPGLDPALRPLLPRRGEGF